MSHIKDAEPDFPISPSITKRWSPYAFDPRPIDRADLCAVWEAARWAASAFNEQPWRFMIAERSNDTAFATMLDCLVPANQAWAKHASAIALGLVHTQFARNGNDNRVALHDLGLAVGNLCAEATLRGISVHQMAGIEPEKARAHYNIPEGVEVVTGIALGYAATKHPNDELLERDAKPRPRRPLGETLFEGVFGSPAALLSTADA